MLRGTELAVALGRLRGMRRDAPRVHSRLRRGGAVRRVVVRGPVEPRPLQGSIVVDGWVSFAAHARVGALVAALREHFDALLVDKAERPELTCSGRPSSGRSCGYCCTTGWLDFYCGVICW